MPRSESWGTMRMGRWDRWAMETSTDALSWRSSDDDPYAGLVAPEPQPESFNVDVNARDYVALIIAEHGEDHLFTFKGAGLYTMTAKLELANVIDKCRRDPVFFVEYYKEHLMHKLSLELVYTAARREETDGPVHICIEPSCLTTRWSAEEDDWPSIRRCDNCGAYTSVSGAYLMEDGIPDACIMNMHAQGITELTERIRLNKICYDIAETNEYAKIKILEARPVLVISNEAPQLQVEGDHFIRARVNRDVLREAGINAYEASSSVSVWFTRSRAQLIELVERLMSDEEIMLDPSRASRFRTEYIEQRWGEEFMVFVNRLNDDGILQVDSSGLNETLTALYHLAQKKAGSRTIIKKNGKIKFPTDDVLENISPLLMATAFMATEHSGYENPGDVFMMGEGAVEE